MLSVDNYKVGGGKRCEDTEPQKHNARIFAMLLYKKEFQS
jgi:hypothetical protein